MIKYIYLGIATFLSATLMGCSNKTDNYNPTPSIYSVLANPETYSTKQITVLGYIQNHGGSWRIFPNPERSILSDYASQIKVGSLQRFPFDCDGQWVIVKGVLDRYIGAYSQFDDTKVDYIVLAETVGENKTPQYCYLANPGTSKNQEIHHPEQYESSD